MARSLPAWDARGGEAGFVGFCVGTLRVGELDLVSSCRVPNGSRKRGRNDAPSRGVVPGR